MRRRLGKGHGPHTAFSAAISLCAAGVLLPVGGPVLSAQATAAGIATCSNAQVRAVITTSQPSYGPGVMVVMRSSVRNVSNVSCSVATGPTSPSLSVTNSKGVVEWSNCDVRDRPETCSPHLVAHTLAPGATYERTFAWNQLANLPLARVAAGTYQLRAKFIGVAGRRVTSFRLTGSAPTGSITVTLADSGRSFPLREGSRLTVQLVGPTIYTWSEPMSTNEAVLERTGGSSGANAVATFDALSAGQVRVTAIDNPNCYPQCLTPSRLFTVTISVVN